MFYDIYLELLSKIKNLADVIVKNCLEGMRSHEAEIRIMILSYQRVFSVCEVFCKLIFLR